MTYWVTYEVNGVDFVFCERRVLVPPEMDLGNPEILKALQLAQKLCPIVDAHETLKQYSQGIDDTEDDWKWLKKESDWALQALWEDWLTLSNSDAIPITPEIRRFCQELKTEIDRREAKEIARREKENRRLKRAKGFVYVLRSPTGLYKIGRTKDPANRKTTFDVKLPFEVEFEHLISCVDMFALEAKLHARFAEKRVNGEWFTLTEEDVAYIKTLGTEK